MLEELADSRMLEEVVRSSGSRSGARVLNELELESTDKLISCDTEEEDAIADSKLEVVMADEDKAELTTVATDDREVL